VSGGDQRWFKRSTGKKRPVTRDEDDEYDDDDDDNNNNNNNNWIEVQITEDRPPGPPSPRYNRYRSPSW
jgi:hypothetical protein